MHRLDSYKTTLIRPRSIGTREPKPRMIAYKAQVRGARTVLIWTLTAACAVTIFNVTPPASAAPPKPSASSNTATIAKKKRSFPGARKVILNRQAVKPKNGKLRLRVKLQLPKGFKINPAAPMGYLLETVGEAGPVDRSKPSSYQLVKPPQESFDLLVPVVGTGEEQLRLSMNYYHCQGDPTSGVCQTGSVILEIPFKVDTAAEQNLVEINYNVPTL